MCQQFVHRVVYSGATHAWSQCASLVVPLCSVAGVALAVGVGALAVGAGALAAGAGALAAGVGALAANVIVAALAAGAGALAAGAGALAAHIIVGTLAAGAGDMAAGACWCLGCRTWCWCTPGAGARLVVSAAQEWQ
jgi:X-X-X-Leu-X-X-Gly heptad repeat protein